MTPWSMTDAPSLRIMENLNELQAQALNRFRLESSRIYWRDDHGIFISEGAFRQVMLLAEESAREFLSSAISLALAVPWSPTKFGLIVDVANSHISKLEALATVGLGKVLSSSALGLADQRFEVIRDRQEKQLERDRPSFDKPKNSGGATVIWDWGGAKAFVRLQFPDGIPAQRGMQARVAEMMQLWFETRGTPVPGKTESFKHAKALMTGEAES